MKKIFCSLLIVSFMTSNAFCSEFVITNNKLITSFYGRSIPENEDIGITSQFSYQAFKERIKKNKKERIFLEEEIKEKLPPLKIKGEAGILVTKEIGFDLNGVYFRSYYTTEHFYLTDEEAHQLKEWLNKNYKE